jgi:DNA polymerase-1
MTRVFQVGGDIHTETAQMLSGVDFGRLTKDETDSLRKKAKPVNFGFLYGMWWKTFKQYAFQNYGVRFSDEEAEQSRETYFDKYYGLIPWHKRQIRMAEKLGYVRYPDGTKRRLPDIYSTDKMVRKEAEHQAINSPVQGFASNICLLSAVILDKYFLDWDECKLVLTVHDALFFEVDEKKINKWLPIIKSTMENVEYVKEVLGVELTIPIKVDVKVGRYWKEGAVEWNGGRFKKPV